ncbi:unnamed protein product, partial [Natator depressus]
MLLPPGHPALLLLAGILLAAAAQDPRYQITQPESLSAPAGGSVTLPCTSPTPRDRAAAGPPGLLETRVPRPVYLQSHRGVHPPGLRGPHRPGRVPAGGAERPRSASTGCRELDAGEYVCHLRVRKNDGQWEQWRGHPGTHLMVTDEASTTHTPCTERTTAQGATQRPAGQGPAEQGPAEQGPAPVIGGRWRGPSCWPGSSDWLCTAPGRDQALGGRTPRPGGRTASRRAKASTWTSGQEGRTSPQSPSAPRTRRTPACSTLPWPSPRPALPRGSQTPVGPPRARPSTQPSGCT